MCHHQIITSERVQKLPFFLSYIKICETFLPLLDLNLVHSIVLFYFSAEPIEERMVHFWVSEHIPNCLFYSAHQKRLLSFTVTKDSDKGKLEKFLSTRLSIIVNLFLYSYTLSLEWFYLEKFCNYLKVMKNLKILCFFII